MAGVQENIDIRIREDGSRVVARNIAGIGEAADGASAGLGVLEKALLGIGAVMSLNKIAEYTGVWTDLTARVARFNTAAGATNAVMTRLQSIAQRTYAPLESIADIYLENAFALQELGRNTSETLDYTEALTNALVVSGAKGQRQETVIRAMSKAMLEGTLSGENWNTVLQQGGRVVEALTAKTGKSLRELDAMARSKKLSSGTVFEALVEQLDMLREEADAMPATIGDAFIRMRNRVVEVIGRMDEELGASQGFVGLVDLLNSHLEIVIATLGGVAVAVAVAFAPGVLLKFIAQVQALWALMAAHPLVAAAAAVAGVTTALYLMRDEIKLGVDDTTTLGDAMTVLGEDMRGVWDALAEHVPMVLGFLGEELRNSVAFWTGINVEGFDKQEEGWLGILRTVIQVFDMIGAVIRGTVMGIVAMFSRMFDGMMDNARLFGEVVSDIMEGNFAEAWRKGSQGKNVFEGVGTAFSEAFQQEVLSQSDQGLEAYFDSVLDRAREVSRERMAEAAAPDLGGPGGGKGGGNSVDKEAARAMARLQRELRGVLDAANPLAAAQRDLADAQTILNRAVAAGLISQADAAAAYKALEFQMRDQLDPLAALNRSIDENIDLLKMSAEQAEIEGQLRRMVQDLQRSGVQLTKEETDALRAKLVVEQELDRISHARDSIERGSSKGQMRGAMDTLAAMEQLEDLTSGDKFNVLDALLGGTLSETQAAFDAQIEQFQNYYAIIEEFRRQDVANEELASQARRAIRQQEMDMYLQRTSDALQAASGLMKSNSKEAFRIGQAAAIGQAIVNTYTAATAAYQSAATIPYVGWLLAPAAAAGAIAAGMAQVSAIRSQQMPAFRTGGTYTVGGNGGVDSQMVAFRATPGEQISINTPSQANAMQNIERLLREDRDQGRGRRNLTQNITIVQQGKPNNKTPEQEARAMFKAGRKLVKVRS